MSGSGDTLRPRYGRIAALGVATSATLVSLVGHLVIGPAEGRAARSDGSAVALAAAPRPVVTSLPDAAGRAAPSGTGDRPGDSAPTASTALLSASSTGLRASLSVGLPALGSTPAAPTPTPSSAGEPAREVEGQEAPLPPHSGTGRRVVFSEGEQRVWLVRGRRDEVVRTYPVSGSIYDNLDQGTYEVFSRSETAIGVDGSDLRWMVRFTHGATSAIGFHWIPRMDGERMQTRAQLGTPLSHGCIRQAAPDARALWRFAPVGTTVVVTA